MTRPLSVLVLNGPNLNLLGAREPEIYGPMTLPAINARLLALAAELVAVDLEFLQSNHEGALVDAIQAGDERGVAGAILNPGGLTHSSISLHDAIKAVHYPVVEVHLSNLHRREEWRQRSYISAAAVGTVMGLGWRGYEMALRALVGLLREADNPIGDGSC
ncbi:MAG TPA: type II 3-dehydroquinate dehydratase [Chloroflexota bacterium]|nr:type II 3-dehydroquinate dehydratase [Chloroflexota bacterium]